MQFALVAIALFGLPFTAAAQSMSARDLAGSLFGKDNKPNVPTSGPSNSATDDLITDIRVEGARTVPLSKVLSQLQSRIGRPYDPQLVQRDVKKLLALPWFVNVETYTDRSDQGLVVIFKVVERPTIRYIEYLGNKSIKDKKLAKETGLVEGAALSPYQVEEGRSRIVQLYKDNGFGRVQVQIVEGSKTDDRGVVFAINEGPQQKVWAVEFEGNEFATDGQLKTKVKTKPGFAYIFKGYHDDQGIEADKMLLTDYYRRFGFFQASVSPIVEWNDKDSWATIRWIVSEGPQSSVRNISIMGNELFATKDLQAGLKLQGENTFERDKLSGDVEWLKELYGSRGYVFADIKADVRYLDEPGKVDLVYSVDEGKQFRVGRIFVNIAGESPHTKITTALNRLSIKPGQIMDIREVRASERRLQASSLFHADPTRNVYPKITFKIPEIEEDILTAQSQPISRGQSPEEPTLTPVPGQPGVYEVERPNAPAPSEGDMDVLLEFDPTIEPVAPPAPQTTVEYPPLPPKPATPSAYSVRKPPVDGYVDAEQPTSNAAYQNLRVTSTNPYQPKPELQFDAAISNDNVYRGQNPNIGWTSGSTPTPRDAVTVAPNMAGQVAQAASAPYGQPAPVNDPNVRPAQFASELPPPPLPPTTLPPGAPLPPSPAILPYSVQEQIVPGVNGMPGGVQPAVDVFVDLEETQTGRFLVGVGVNSNAGVVGQILLDERNFDWRRAPRSWQDVVDGTAWRGAGQRMRLEAAPGSEVQRYLASFQEPFLMGTPISLTLSGSYFDRRYLDWDEQRIGGRVGLGYQWVQSDVSTNFTYRGENVKITNPSNPAEPQLAEVLGNNVLHGFRLAVINDTRDNAFLATQGHYFEVYGEQVVGTFDYPRVGVDFKKYFLFRERADHSGRHVVSMTTAVDYTGSNTPIYEHFFAGGFSSLRGFDFRGASPVSQGVQVGGEFSWINSVEYMFPLTADDMLHGVAFCDFGTVEPGVEINDFRVSPGVGLRITVPAMGPAPIALDFAYPVVKADTDDTQVFSFSIGFLR